MVTSRLSQLACAAFVALLMVLAPQLSSTAHAQDARAEARAHYQKGKGLFDRGEYRAAIAEFAAADNLAPAPMLEFNIALCYDRLGDRAEALRRYRLYLRELPSAQNRAAVEAKIRRLEGELRAEAEKRRPAPVPVTPAPAPTPEPAPAPTPEPAPVPAPETNGVPAPTGGPAPAPETSPTPAPEGPAPAEVYTPGGEEPAVAEAAPAAPSAGTSYTGNDPDLARVAAIDIQAIRNQRLRNGGSSAAAVGATASAPGPDTNANGYAASGVGNNGQGYGAPAPNSGSDPTVPGGDKPKKEKPVYKKWWFWAVVGVSAIILINMASTDSGSEATRLIIDPQLQSAAPAPGGLEWRF